MKPPKVLVLDVDGVLTDGTKYYENGKPIGKVFNDKDFTAIKLFKAKGVAVVFLSADASNIAIAKDRNILFYPSRDKENLIIKEKVIHDIAKDHSCYLKDVWYVGDDLLDLLVIGELNLYEGWTFCPMDAPLIVQNHCGTVIPLAGGEGLIMWLAQVTLGTITFEDIYSIMELDKDEGWSNTAR
jgi:3-deoxy-D-manno-octulosonate 8-phosphate phosphatase (KDO 8-P phosphatase)